MIKTLVFVPYQQLGPLEFGMSQEQVRKACGEPISSCMYGFPVENRYLDDYGTFHTLCSSNQLLEAVELFPDTSAEDIYVECKGQSVYISKDIGTLIEELRKITDDLIVDEEAEGYSSRKLGLKIYCPDDVVEDVMIHDAHCYDEEEEYIAHMGNDEA